eukprot:12670310-Heterocapsa_arctica.AAC.1
MNYRNTTGTQGLRQETQGISQNAGTTGIQQEYNRNTTGSQGVQQESKEYNRNPRNTTGIHKPSKTVWKTRRKPTQTFEHLANT